VRGQHHVSSLTARLDQLYKRVDRIDPGEFQLRSDFAQHLCVQTSGYLENVVQELARECCRRRSGGPIQSFAISRLARSRNPSVEYIVSLVQAFDAQWADDLEVFLTPERRAAIDSVVSRRNELAHGALAGISIVQVTEYYGRIKEVIEYLSDLFDPPK
jgi:RiboL-PSP-HEPN